MRVALLLLLAAAGAAADELRNAESAVIRALEKARASVVTVFTPRPDDFDVTGVVISSGGGILTLRSPFLGADGTIAGKVLVRFPGKGESEEATLIDEDEATDTILLKAYGARNKGVRGARADEVQLGMWVLLVGNAFGAGRESEATASLGVISGIARKGDRPHAFHASALVNPGSFGAPVLDLTGSLVGITAPQVTGAGQQSVILPFEFLRERYREKGGAAAREMAGDLTTRRGSSDIANAYGLVLQAVAQEGSRVLVGVRAGALPGETAPQEAPAEEGKEVPPKAKKPPLPDPVPGARPAHDRSSGVIVDAAGLIAFPLRACGWPGPPRPLLVDLGDGRSLTGTLLGYDERLRIAILSVEARGLPTLAETPPEEQVAGRIAIALGYPHEAPTENTPQLTAGILSRTGALFGLHSAIQALQTDAGVGGGNRGGPLLDVEGRLLGVLLDVNDSDPMGYHMRVRGSYAGNAGLGFALPMQVLRALLPRLAKGEVLREGFLGLSVDESPEGVRIVAVTEKNSKGEPTGAFAAGLAKGDLVLSIAGKPLERMDDLRKRISEFTAGEEIEIVRVREGEQAIVRVRLTER